ncbi:MAG: hypothetical protein KF713_09495 [Turneriella sp.]|nr:hypothetical protein [Turneriella sp.]
MTSSRFTAFLLSLLLSSVALVGDVPEERIQIWQPRLKRFIKNKPTMQNAQEEGFGYVTLNGKRHFFKNETDFKQWVQSKAREEDQIRNRLEYFSQKNNVVQSCLSKLPDRTKTVKVEYDFRQCGGYYGNPVNYVLLLKDDFITIDLRLELVYKGLPENMGAVKNAINAAQPCIRKIMANQGIQFQLSYGYADEGGLKDSFAKVDIYDIRPGKSNAAEWSVLSSQGRVENPNRICTMMTHELLHLLGLGDTYARPNCPQREAGKPNEIMANSSVLPEAAKLTEIETRRIIAPLCPVKK